MSTSLAVTASLEPKLVELVKIQTTALEIEEGKVVAIYVIRNRQAETSALAILK